MEPVISKAGMLEQIQAGRAGWERLLAEIGEDRMTQPGPMGGWTFKDVIAHLDGWRWLTLARLEAALRGTTPAAPPWPAHLDADEEDDIKGINDWIYETNRDRPLAEVLAESRQSLQRLQVVVEALSEADLTEPGRFAWAGDWTLGEVVEGSLGHLQEHTEDIRAWLNTLDKTGV